MTPDLDPASGLDVVRTLHAAVARDLLLQMVVLRDGRCIAVPHRLETVRARRA